MDKQIVVFSHGFGVRKDDRGLFTDIAAGLPGTQAVLFDYNEINEDDNTLTVAPLDKQAERLGEVVAAARTNNPGASIDLICHSQGCIAAALLRPADIRSIIFIAPPAGVSVDGMIGLFAGRHGSEINLKETSRLSRADFSTTIVPPDYWLSIQDIHPIELYNHLSQVTPLTIFNASQDEIISDKDFSGLDPNIHVIELSAGHNFEGKARKKLIAVIAQELRMREPIYIVDKHDTVIGYKARADITPGDIYRVTGLWLTNSHGDVLLAQRKLTKKHDPGKWGPATAGTVEKDESYDENIVKEIREELGLDDIALVKGPKTRVSHDYNYFVQWYTATIDLPTESFVIEKNAVEQVRWFSPDALKRELSAHPDQFVGGLKELYGQLAS